EILSECKNYLVAYRANRRYVPLLDKISSDTLEEREFDIKENGVYIITGGVGGIGLEVAKYLASKAKVNIALISRTRFPVDEEWDTILEKESDYKLKHKIEILKN